MPLGIWSRFQSLIFGGAIGAAASEAIAPALEPARQHAWSQNQVRVLDPAVLAGLVAEGAISLPDASALAERNGFAPSAFAGYVQLALHGPGLGEALRAYLRDGQPASSGGQPDIGPGITKDKLHHAYQKAGIEQQYWAALDGLAQNPLDPAVLANAIVRGIMPAPFPLPFTPPAGTGKVQAFPTSPLDPTDEAQAGGLSVERLFVLTAIAGRPMAPEEAAKASFRGIIDRENDYQRAILEGDIRGEWSDAIYEYTREILTAHDHVELRLRGWYTDDAEMYAGTAQHGMTQANTDLLFKVLGRPISYRNVFLGERRGGAYVGDLGSATDPIDKSLRESNIRPEWYDLARHLLFTQPTLFFVRSWLKDGHPEAQARTWLFRLGYSQEDIDAIVLAYAKPATATTDPHVRSAVTAAYSALRKLFVNGTYTEGEVSGFDAQLVAAQQAADPLIAVLNVLKIIENPPTVPPIVAP